MDARTAVGHDTIPYGGVGRVPPGARIGPGHPPVELVEESSMGRWTYYSPLWLGALLVFALNDALRQALPPLEPWAHWLIVVVVAVVVGVQCQVLMVGAQGAFAQVLPVPIGRSIRGRAAVIGGWLLIAWVTLACATVLLGYEEVTLAARVLGGMSVASLAGAIVVYVWNIPAVVADFGEGNGGRV